MAMNRDDLSEGRRFTQSYSSADKINDLRLYYVRIHDKQANLNLQANFGNEIILTFDMEKQLDDNSNLSPVIYTLDLTLKKETGRPLNIQTSNKLWKPIDRLRIQGRSRGLLNVTTMIYKEKDEQGHTLEDYFGCEYCFLLDIRFNSKLGNNLPGKNLSKRENSIIWIIF